jgi:hypothetical protein
MRVHRVSVTADPPSSANRHYATQSFRAESIRKNGIEDVGPTGPSPVGDFRGNSWVQHQSSIHVLAFSPRRSGTAANAVKHPESNLADYALFGFAGLNLEQRAGSAALFVIFIVSKNVPLLRA